MVLRVVQEQVGYLERLVLQGLRVSQVRLGQVERLVSMVRLDRLELQG